MITSDKAKINRQHTLEYRNNQVPLYHVGQPGVNDVT